MSKLNPKSLKCIFLSYSRVHRCYCPSLRKYLVSTNVTFLENTSFSQDPIHTSQGNCDDLLVYTQVSPAPVSVSPLTKPPITQVYAQRQHPLVLSPPPAASTKVAPLAGTPTQVGKLPMGGPHEVTQHACGSQQRQLLPSYVLTSFKI